MSESEDDEASFDRRIAVVGIVGVYAIYLILTAYGSFNSNGLSDFFSEFIDLSDKRRQIGKALFLPLLYAIFLSVTGFAEFLSERYDWINFLIGILLSLSASILSAYMINFLFQPKYDKVHKDLYQVLTFIMSLAIPYFLLISSLAFRNIVNRGSK